jgi:hypothetical protein
MSIVIVLELRELRFQVDSCPKQSTVQVLATNGSNQSLDERMRYWHIGHCFDLRNAKDSKVRLSLMESIQRIMIRTQIFRNRLPSNRSMEHAAKSPTIHDPDVNSESDNAPSVLIHDHQHLVGP